MNKTMRIAMSTNTGTGTDQERTKDRLGTSIQIVNPTTIPGWDNLLLSTHGCSFFHSSKWAQTLSEAYGYTPRYFTIMRDERLFALVPMMEISSIFTGRKGVSLPFTDYCDPIVHESISFQELLYSIMAYGRQERWRSFEVRGGQHLLPFGAVASATYLRHLLNLTNSSEGIFRAFRKGTKSAVKKAEKAGLKIRIECSEKAIMEFYELNCITRKFHGLPPQPKSFFKSIHRHVLQEGSGIVILASHEGNNIAGGVFFHFADEAIYKYGASRREYQDLRATNLIIWNSISYYLHKGYRKFCFGRTEPDNEGLRIFKNGWGTQEHSISYFKYDLRQSHFVNRNAGGLSRYPSMIFSKMPIGLLKIIGDVLYRHMG